MAQNTTRKSQKLHIDAQLEASLLLFLIMYDQCRYGDMLSVTGQLYKPVWLILHPSLRLLLQEPCTLPIQPVIRRSLKPPRLSFGWSFFSLQQKFLRSLTCCLPLESSFCPSLFLTWESGVSQAVWLWRWWVRRGGAARCHLIGS